MAPLKESPWKQDWPKEQRAALGRRAPGRCPGLLHSCRAPGVLVAAGAWESGGADQGRQLYKEKGMGAWLPPTGAAGPAAVPATGHSWSPVSAPEP